MLEPLGNAVGRKHVATNAQVTTCNRRASALTSDLMSALVHRLWPGFRPCRFGLASLIEEMTVMTSPDDIPTTATTIPVASSGARTWVLALAAGLAAGVLAWGIGEAVIVPETGIVSGGGMKVPPSVDGTRNGTVSFGVLGAVLGFALGLAGGLIRRSFLWACLAAVAGLLLGGGAGVVTAQSLVPVYYEHQRANDLTYSLTMHGGILAAVGAATGLAFGIGLGGWGRMIRVTVAGAGAAALAAVIYEFAGGILFPTAQTDHPVSLTWQTRLVARLLVTVLVAAVLAAGSSAKALRPNKG